MFRDSLLTMTTFYGQVCSYSMVTVSLVMSACVPLIKCCSLHDMCSSFDIEDDLSASSGNTWTQSYSTSGYACLCTFEAYLDEASFESLCHCMNSGNCVSFPVCSFRRKFLLSQIVLLGQLGMF